MILAPVGLSVLLFASYSYGQQPAFAPGAPSNICTTQTGKQCIFPFRFKGVDYYECTRQDSDDGQAWCAHQVRRDGITAVPGQWENCDLSVCQDEPECYTNGGPDAGGQCVFPFTFKGVTHYTCARWTFGGNLQGAYWCSTKTRPNGQHDQGKGRWGLCGDFCPLPKDAVFNSPGAFASAPANSPPAGSSPS